MSPAPTYQMRLEPERREQWEKAAAERGLKLAEWIKFVCDANASYEPQGKPLVEVLANLEGDEYAVTAPVVLFQKTGKRYSGPDPKGGKK